MQSIIDSIVSNIINGFRKLFGLKLKDAGKKNKLSIDGHELEPKYWPEVIHFMQHINALIESHTIDDDNIRIVNQRIVDYMVKEINAKGSIEDINKRYDALDTLADRILVTNLSKIVGLKTEESKKADFTAAIKQFKDELHKRHEAELLEKSPKN